VGDDRIDIPGSIVNQSGSISTAADPNQVVDATIVVRRPAASAQTAAGLLSGRRPEQTREEMEQLLAADPSDMEAVAGFARQFGLRVVEESPPKRMVRVEGTVRQMNAAFGVDLAYFVRPAGAPFLSYNGPVRLPSTVSAVVSAVLGLQREPIDKRR
jgi:kumamolisin